MSDPFNVAGPILDALASHMLALGRFERVNRHEPKSSPGSGVSASLWLQDFAPVPAASGLNVTTGRLEFSARLMTSMIVASISEADEIDPMLSSAAFALMSSLTGGFTLGGLVRNIDLLGAHGAPLGWRAGYLEIDRKYQRVVTMTIPLIVSDVFSQAA